MSNIVHSQSPRPDVLQHVARNLLRLRKEAGLSQAALAAASGISRRMIVSLEAGERNVSLASLDRLAEALGTTFVALVSDPGASPARIEAVAWRGEGPASEAVLLGTAPARREAQLWLWTLDVGDRYVAEPDPPGWHEGVFVVGGCLRLELAGEVRVVATGGFSIYGTAQPYAYANAGEGILRFVRMVVS